MLTDKKSDSVNIIQLITRERICGLTPYPVGCLWILIKELDSEDLSPAGIEPATSP